MTTRTERLKEKMLSYPYEVCVERARYWTESHKQTAGMPEVIRNAKAFENVLEKMTIYINDEELVVGCRSSKPKATPLFPEVRSTWIEAQLNTFENRPIQPFFVSREVKKELRKILPYWRGRSAWDRALHLMSKETQMEIYKIVFTVHAEFANGIGHFLVGHDNVLRKGLNEIVEDAGERLKNASGDVADFLKAVIITCRAAMDFSKRCASLAENMAEKESNPARKEELKKIAEACRWIPDNPPRSFYEALQCVCLVHHICQIECGGFAISVGRLDQMLYPYYKRDLDDGKITRAQAQELMECFYIKTLGDSGYA